MEPTLLPLVTPSVSFQVFSTLLDQATVNKHDGKSKIQMFETLAFLTTQKADAAKHLKIAFFFSAPIVVLPELLNLGLPIEFSIREEGFLVKGIMSASVSCWKQLIESDIKNPYLIKLVSQLPKHLV